MNANDSDIVFIKPLYLSRKRYAILRRRAERSGRSVEAEASRLLSWTLLELVEGGARGAALLERIQQLGAEREATDER